MRKLLICGLAVVLLASSTSAVASIPAGNGTIYGCRNKSTGAVRVIDTALSQTCTTAEAALNWNQTGKTLTTFDYVEPSWYLFTAQIKFFAGDGPVSGQLTCRLGGGSEEPFGGDTVTVALSPTDRNGQIKLQTTGPVNNEYPIVMSCSVEGASEGDPVRIYEFWLLLTKLSPREFQQN